MYKILQYKYSDTPDGKDGLKKMFCTCKYAAAVGGTMGLFDLVFHSQVTKFTSKLNVLGAYIVPAMGFTAAYTATVYMGTNLRGKDDYWNYAFAAVVTCGVIGIARRNISDGFAVFPILTLLSVLYKRGRQRGGNMFDQKMVKEGRTYYRDLSLVKDYPRNYTKSS